MDAEPSLGCAFSICVPSSSAVLMLVALINERGANVLLFVLCYVLFCFRTPLEKVSEDLTSIISNVPCKCLGAFHICSVGLNKFSLPVKYVAVECDQTKEVIFCQVVQDVDQCDAGLDERKRLFTCRAHF